jgi:hypothetical protein
MQPEERMMSFFKATQNHLIHLQDPDFEDLCQDLLSGLQLQGRRICH